MIARQQDGQSGTQAQAAAGKAWTTPAVSQLRAGAAEAIPGTAFSDATLETIGS